MTTVIKPLRYYLEEKKAYAVNLASDYLSHLGINVPHDLIDGMIEAQLMQFRIEASQHKE